MAKKKSKGRRSKASAETKNTKVTETTDEASKEQADSTKEDEESDEETSTDESEKVSEPPPASAKPVKKAPRSRKGSRSTGVLAVYDHPDTILSAAEKARDEGFEKWDVYTPFPVHGMDDAMGLGRSPVPWITFTMGVVGFVAAIIIQFGTMVYSWPLNFGGKPFAAWPSFVPITFEMTVLFAGVSTAVGSLVLGGMFKLRKRKRVPHPAVTSHRFAIFVEAADPKFDEDETLSLFEATGAIEVRAVKEGE